MVKIESRTSYRTFSKAAIVKPEAPLFLFKNVGNTDVFINNDRLEPGGVFGLDNSTFLAIGFLMGKAVEVKEMTDYSIHFGATVTDGGTGLYGNVPSPVCLLITVEYQKK